MNKRICLILVAFLLSLGGTALAHQNAAVVRGGAMYDKWWAVIGVDAPANDHPLWGLRPDTTSNTRTGADTWRCKECHGWDYNGVNGRYGSGSHRTGIPGILHTTKTAPEVFELIKTDHGYGTVGLSDEDIWDLTVFVIEGLINTDSIIDSNGVFIGDIATGQILYDTGISANVACAACHGQLGLTPPPGHADFEDYVGLISTENPWEFQHKVQFGQPGTAMPSSVAGGGSILDVADLGAYAQTLPQTPIKEQPVVRGGAMYDKWWVLAGLPAPTTDHPLWASRPDDMSNGRTGADTWRCKECHGWDYKGIDGVYGSGSHRTGIVGILGTTKTAQEVFDLLKDDHAYGTVGLSDDDIWDMAAFVTEGLIDTDMIIDADGMFIGDVANGKILYDSGIGTNISCLVCHGQVGLNPPPGHADFEDYVGLISNENPWEFQHKVQFGQPGTAMPSSVAGGGSTLEVADLGAYAQTLPQEPAPASITFDPETPESVLSEGKLIFEGACGLCHNLPTTEDMKAFPTDDALVTFEMEMADMAGLSDMDAEYVIRYLLALRHDVPVVSALDVNQPQTLAMLAGLLGIGVYLPARHRWRRRTTV
jgi:cytochrome c553